MSPESGADAPAVGADEPQLQLDLVLIGPAAAENSGPGRPPTTLEILGYTSPSSLIHKASLQMETENKERAPTKT